ncbi:hypothetical protein SEMRO_929_G221330.1 [Seminavis robusta]|uniref:Uncharacterized protein n=1 Tax=Seminavis robusta TaxID=568900 RepID=A0A9N8EDS5_9STRA|nr:hypothetical protein SEMRO_929_G221330.1 [Seminavis robusta]|eukprot:Sro929_g221330.1 n/a (128) ;mRNA; f:22434-22817
MSQSPFDIPTPMEEGEQEELPPNPPSPMDQPPLSQQPEVETVNEDDENLADHVKDRRQPGEPNRNDDPLDLKFDFMHKENPTVEGLPPEEMLDRTFLMPPAEDGTRVRAKIIERVDNTKKNSNNTRT